jgi:hypothetical protein
VRQLAVKGGNNKRTQKARMVDWVMVVMDKADEQRKERSGNTKTWKGLTYIYSAR